MSSEQRRRGRLASLAVLSAAVLVLAGCSGSSSGSKPQASTIPSSGKTLSAMKADLASHTGLATSLPTVTAVPKAPSLRGKTIWWVPLGGAVDASFGSALKEATGKLGITVHTCDGKFLPTTVASCLQQASSQNPAAVMTGYVDYKSVPTAFNALEAKGIPVLLAGATNNSGKPQSAKFAFADSNDINESLAKLELEQAITSSHGKAHLLYVAFDDSAQLSAISSYGESFVKANCAQCTFDVLHTNSASLTKLASLVGSGLTSHPNTDYVVVQIDPGVAPVLQAIRTAGLQSKVKVIGAGGLPDTIADLQSGNSPLVADAGVSLAYEVWAFTQSLVQMLTGAVPPAQITSLPRVFTADNVKGLSPRDFTTLNWYASSDAVISSFTKAWSVG